jgi:hypothetical protein
LSEVLLIAFYSVHPYKEPIMSEVSEKSAGTSAIPDDDPRRGVVVARPDTDASLEHVALVGDTYTILLRSAGYGWALLFDRHAHSAGRRAAAASA